MNIKLIRAATLCLALCALTPQSHSAEIAVPRDGWASWQVDAVEGAPAFCCLSSWNASASQKACKLDDKHANFGSRDSATTDAVRVYARISGGKVERLRVFSATCPVEAATPIRDLGNQASDDSARWLITLSRHSPDLSEDLQENVLAGLAMHRGDVARNELTAIARGPNSAETRKKAIFWLAQVGGVAGAEVATSVMFNDKDPQLREYAAFAVSQSNSPRIAADLTRLGNTDPNAEVRGQAWFWLAQSGVPDAEAAIVAALRKDKDDEVREQAIAALAQLPDERATRALIATAEDRSLSSEQRKRAVFWLAQSESQAAQKYLEKVLAGNATH